MRIFACLLTVAWAAGSLAAQEAASPVQGPAKAEEVKTGEYLIDTGTRIPLTLLNSLSTKHSVEGDRVYLQTAFPIMAKGRIVIPPGSFVAGTITEVKRPGRVKGRGELFLRFDSLILPNGVTRDFRARIGAADDNPTEGFDRTEGKVKSEGNKAGDARTVAGATEAGTEIGTVAGAAAGHWELGMGVGAAAGAAAGLMGVLLTRGPDAVLTKGSTVEMVLDRQLHFQETELNFGTVQPVPVSETVAPPGKNSSAVPVHRFPF